jgi:hypothetical protein
MTRASLPFNMRGHAAVGSILFTALLFFFVLQSSSFYWFYTSLYGSRTVPRAHALYPEGSDFDFSNHSVRVGMDLTASYGYGMRAVDLLFE